MGLAGDTEDRHDTHYNVGDHAKIEDTHFSRPRCTGVGEDRGRSRTPTFPGLAALVWVSCFRLVFGNLGVNSLMTLRSTFLGSMSGRAVVGVLHGMAPLGYGDFAVVGVVRPVYFRQTFSVESPEAGDLWLFLRADDGAASISMAKRFFDCEKLQSAFPG